LVKLFGGDITKKGKSPGGLNRTDCKIRATHKKRLIRTDKIPLRDGGRIVGRCRGQAVVQ